MKKLFVLMLAAMLIVTACNDDEHPGEHMDEGEHMGEGHMTDEDMNEMKHEGVMAMEQWIRPAAEGRNTAAFMNVMNYTMEDDTLYMAESDLAETVEIHESYETEDGRMGMRKVDGVAVGMNRTAMLEPGGYHVMLIGLKQDLKIGDTGTVTLHFKKAGAVEVTAEVADRMPMPEMHHEH